MANKDVLVKELVELIKKMDIPQHRKSVSQKEDLRWLKRSLAARNSEHNNFPRVMAILKELV